MRLHVTCFYALMLTLTYNFSINITCNGAVQKRAIDFDEIADFADITEAEPLRTFEIRNSVDEIKPFNVKETREIKPFAVQGGVFDNNAISEKSSEPTAMFAKSVPKNDIDKLLNFRMKQLKYMPRGQVREKRLANDRKFTKRFVSFPAVVTKGGGKSYIGNLAAATNDVNLKMQNYAATLILVVTTPKESLGVATKSTEKLIDEKLLQTFTSGGTTTMSTPMPLTKSVMPNARSLPATGEKPPVSSTPSSVNTSLKTTIQAQHRFEDDYPLVAADGFFTGMLDDDGMLPNAEMRTRKRAKRESMPDFKELLKVVKVREDPRMKKSKVTLTPLTTSFPLPLSTNVAGTSTTIKGLNDNVQKINELLSLVAIPTIPKLTESSSASSTRACSQCTESSSSSTHMPSTQATQVTTGTVNDFGNPYKWENDIIKELNVKFKKDAKATTTLGSALGVTRLAYPKGVRQDTSPATKQMPPTATVVGPTGPATVPVCKGKECQKMMQDFFVYNDTADDCGKEDDADTGTGGYNIISNEETPTTKSVKCPVSFTTTELTTTSMSSCGDRTPGGGTPKNPCEPTEDESDENEPEMCEMSVNQVKAVQACKAKEKKKKKKQKAKTSQSIDKRQIGFAAFNSLQTSGFAQSSVPNYDGANNFPTPPGAPSNGYAYNAQNSVNFMSTATVPTVDKMFKKSIDKNVVSTVIENLKIVDQKLAEAVDPLHSAQEQLDTAGRSESVSPSSGCESTTACHIDGGLFNEFSDAEKEALQRLALKIMANQCPKSKRDGSMPILPMDHDPREMAKRGAIKSEVKINPLESNDYEDADEDRLNRLQRDIFVAQEIETIVERLKHKRDKDYRGKRNFLYPHELVDKGDKRDNGDKKYDDFGERSDNAYDSDEAKLVRGLDVINTRAKENEDVTEEYHSPRKKTKPKKLWRKLFGLTSTRGNNRFLDQDISNLQSTQQSRSPKKKKKDI